MTHILIPREPSTALLRPFIGCNTQELHEAWAAMVRIAEVQHDRAGSQGLQQITEPATLAGTTIEQYARMFGAACDALGEISDCLGINSDINPGAEPIIAAIEQLRAGAAPAAVSGPANDLAELAMLNKLIELGTQAYGALATSNSDDGPAGTAAYVRWQERRAEMGELIRAHKAPALEAPAAPVDEHAAFQADYLRWCPGKQGRLGRDGAGGYGHAMVQARWLGWSARAALAAAPQAPAAPSDAQLLSEWDRVSGLTKATERRLACMRAVLQRWGSAAPAAPAVDATSDTALLDAMGRERIAVIPEFEGPWDAQIFGEDEAALACGSGATPREAITEALASLEARKAHDAAQAKEGGEAC